MRLSWIVMVPSSQRYMRTLLLLSKMARASATGTGAREVHWHALVTFGQIAAVALPRRMKPGAV